MHSKPSLSLRTVSTPSTFKLSHLVQDIHNAGRDTQKIQRTLPELSLSKEELKKKYNKLYSGYLAEKKAIEKGLLTPSHLNKYLQPKRKHLNVKNEVQFLFRSTLKNSLNKVRAANFILNSRGNTISKAELIQSTINSNEKSPNKTKFLYKIQEIFLKQKNMKLNSFQSAPMIEIGSTEII